MIEQRRESTKSQASVKQEESPVEIKKEDEVIREGWAGFDTAFNNVQTAIPASESDFFTTNAKQESMASAFGEETGENGQKAADPFAPTINAFDADPFDTRPIEEIVSEAKKKAELEASLQPEDNNLLHGSPATTRRSTSRGSTPTPEGGSPVSPRPMGFEDEFKAVNTLSNLSPFVFRPNPVLRPPYTTRMTLSHWKNSSRNSPEMVGI